MLVQLKDGRWIRALTVSEPHFFLAWIKAIELDLDRGRRALPLRAGKVSEHGRGKVEPSSGCNSA